MWINLAESFKFRLGVNGKTLRNLYLKSLHSLGNHIDNVNLDRVVVSADKIQFVFPAEWAVVDVAVSPIHIESSVELVEANYFLIVVHFPASLKVSRNADRKLVSCPLARDCKIHTQSVVVSAYDLLKLLTNK